MTAQGLAPLHRSVAAQGALAALQALEAQCLAAL
jgi:hypothetical protein